MDKIDAMAVFVEIVQAGSFTAAGKRLGMPLSTVSRKISELEDALQVRLLERGKRKVRVTEVGTAYFEHCRRGVEAFKTANRIVAERQSDASGSLRITVPPNLAERLLLPIIGLFQQRYPKARVAIFVTERVLDFVEHQVDVSFRVTPVAAPKLVVRKLVTYRHLLVASPMYVAERGCPRIPGDLAEHRIVGFGFQGRSQVDWSFSRGETRERMTLQPDLAVNDYAAVQTAVAWGLGIGELPSILCQEGLRQRKLMHLMPEWLLPEIDLLAVHTGTKGLSRLARLFLDMCAEHLSPTAIKTP